MVHEFRTRGDRLAFAISFALIRAVKVIRGLRQGLTNEERHAVADDAVNEMKKYGDPWRLNEEIPRLVAAQEQIIPTGWQRPSTERPKDSQDDDR
jgi:hypothetical protein